MRSIFMKAALLTLVALICSQSGFAYASHAQKPFEDLEISFPDIEGWVKGKIVKYPDKKMGYGINYESETGGRISLYVYNAGLKRIPDGINSDIVKDELKEAEGGLYSFQRMGYYKNVKRIKQDTVTFNREDDGFESLRSLFSFNARGRKLTSEIYLFGYENHFIKIRTTRLYDKDDSENEAVKTFFLAMNKLFSKPNPKEDNSQVGM